MDDVVKTVAEEQPKLFDVGETKPIPPPPPPPPEPPKIELPDPTMPMPFEKLTGAAFDEKRIYRYMLWRRILEKGNTITWIGLNPSTADEEVDDPTVKRVVSFSKAWGYAKVYMVNLFAFRATNPKDMKKAADPGGPENLGWIVKLCNQSQMCLAAWGNNGSFGGSGKNLLKQLDYLGIGPIHCLGVTKKGHPKHPLYLSRNTKPQILMYKQFPEEKI
jgi:hypothetical protein